MNIDWSQYGQLAIGYSTKVLGALALFVVAWMVAGFFSRVASKSVAKSNLDRTLGEFVAKLVKWSILALSIVSILGIFGVQTTSFAAVIAAAGLAVGLALQGTLSHFAAGVMILLFRPFKLEDVITVGGQTGKVVGIDLFNTALDTPDNRRIIIPNSNVFGNVIENVTAHPIRRVDVTVGADYAAGVDETRAHLEEAVKKTPNVLQDPESAIVLTDLGDSSVNWVVRAWTQTPNYFQVKEDLTRAIKLSLDEAGIGIPYPQMDLHIQTPMGMAVEDSNSSQPQLN